MEHKDKFIFNRSNYIYLIIGVVLNVIGFLLMIGGAAENLNEFNEDELFSSVRITISPIIILIGYAVIIYSIMKKPKPTEDQNTKE
jgi:heme/copper-type cytochrome/quinol oxidase subunit 2